MVWRFRFLEEKMKNIITALVIIGGSLFFYSLAGQFPEVKGYQQMGDAFWPRLILLVLMGLSALLLIQALWGRGKEKPGKELSFHWAYASDILRITASDC